MTRTALLASTALTFVSITPLVAQSAECIASGANLVCLDTVNQPFASEDAEASIVILSEASVVSADIEVPAIVISGDDTTMTNRGLVEQSNPEDDGHAITGSSDGITIINRGRIASGDRGIEMLGGSNLNVANQSGATISTRGQGVRAGTETARLRFMTCPSRMKTVCSYPVVRCKITARSRVRMTVSIWMKGSSSTMLAD